MTVHKRRSQYGYSMPLADTPTTWPVGPSISTLHVLLVFAGIPLLVILTISLLVLAPGWGKGPRYRPGQPWGAENEWFASEPAPDNTGGLVGAGHEASVDAPGSGGASAGW